MPRANTEAGRIESYRLQVVELRAKLLKIGGEFTSLSKAYEAATLEMAKLRNQLEQAKQQGFLPDYEPKTLLVKESSDRDQSQQI